MGVSVPLLLAGVIVFELLAMLALTTWTKTDSGYLYAAGVLCYVVVAVLFGALIKAATASKLAVLNSIWQVVNLLTVVALGVILFSNALAWYQWLAVALAVVATVLLGYGEYASSAD